MAILQVIRGGYVRISVDGRNRDMTVAEWSVAAWYR